MENNKFRLLSISIVVSARDHNPSLLNPDFMERRRIVPKGYELSEPPLCTPPISVLKYRQGIDFVVEPNKLQVLERIRGKFPGRVTAPKIAARYITTLPHVKYTGVGINFFGVFNRENPELWLKERFINKGPWDEEPTALSSVEFKFVYPVEDALLNVLVRPGKINLPSVEQEPGVSVNFNYHHDIVQYPADVQVCEKIDLWRVRKTHLKKTLKRIFGVEA